MPLLFTGRAELEQIVPITFFAKVLAVNHRALTPDEAELWLERLDWEGEQQLFGVLNMYVCTGTVPAARRGWAGHGSRHGSAPKRGSAGSGVHARLPQIRRLVAAEAASAGPAVAALINAAYAVSDTGITLSTARIPAEEVASMIRRGEIWAAQAGGDSGEFVGCIQVMLKGCDDEEAVAEDGVDTGDGGEGVGEDSDVPQNEGLPTTHSGAV